jgi:histidine ammonia-lyase
VQDAYSLRCAPQVAGAAGDTVAHAATMAGRELAASINNRSLRPTAVESNGNFHGAPVGYVLDFLATTASSKAGPMPYSVSRCATTSRTG